MNGRYRRHRSLDLSEFPVTLHRTGAPATPQDNNLVATLTPDGNTFTVQLDSRRLRQVPRINLGTLITQCLCLALISFALSKWLLGKLV